MVWYNEPAIVRYYGYRRRCLELLHDIFSFLPFFLHIFIPFSHFHHSIFFLIAWYKTWRWDVLLRGFIHFLVSVYYFLLRASMYHLTKPNQLSYHSAHFSNRTTVGKIQAGLIMSFSINGCAYHFSFSFLPLDNTITSFFFYLMFSWLYLCVPGCF